MQGLVVARLCRIMEDEDQGRVRVIIFRVRAHFFDLALKYVQLSCVEPTLMNCEKLEARGLLTLLLRHEVLRQRKSKCLNGSAALLRRSDPAPIS